MEFSNDIGRDCQYLLCNTIFSSINWPSSNEYLCPDIGTTAANAYAASLWTTVPTFNRICSPNYYYLLRRHITWSCETMYTYFDNFQLAAFESQIMGRPENEMVAVRRQNGTAVVALEVITLKIKFDFCSGSMEWKKYWRRIAHTGTAHAHITCTDALSESDGNGAHKIN